MPSNDPKFNRLPVRISVKGDLKNVKTGVWTPFEIQLEFYEFRTKILDETVFLVSHFEHQQTCLDFFLLTNKKKC